MIELRSDGLNFMMAMSQDEDKEAICKALAPVLRMTRNLHDLLDLEYDFKTEQVTAYFPGGTKRANVNMDSGTAMIRDIIAQIV